MIDWLVTNWKDIVLVITSVVTAASIIVKLTPTPKDDTIMAAIMTILRALALYKEPDAPKAE